jgi:Cof subfamily protein (haloacid dehalogenase superfamily)
VTDETILAELERGFGPFIDSVIVGADPGRDDINKISFLHSEVTLDEVRAQFSDTFTIIPGTVPVFGPNSGELSIPGIHKAGAIQTLLDHLGLDLADTMAYGDGHNDLEMLQHVAVGVAMGNAVPELKDIADDITGSPDEDGLFTSFTKYGLI